MSIDYESKPISKIKFDGLKRDLSLGKISGLVYAQSDKGDVKKFSKSFLVKDNKGNIASAYKANGGNVLFTFYGVTSNSPWYILYKLSKYYKCAFVDEEGADGRASDYLALWKEDGKSGISDESPPFIRKSKWFLFRPSKKSVKKSDARFKFI